MIYFSQRKQNIKKQNQNNQNKSKISQITPELIEATEWPAALRFTYAAYPDSQLFGLAAARSQIGQLYGLTTQSSNKRLVIELLRETLFDKMKNICFTDPTKSW